MNTILVAVLVCFGLIFLEKFLKLINFIFGFCVTLQEREARVYTLFGEIVGTIDTAGLHFLWFELGIRALIINTLGKDYKLNLNLDQEYIRSIPVNSEEGTPMGIGVWYEMYIVDPIAHIFRNTDPQGSLNVSVRNATIKCLSNLPLANMLVNRHGMSSAVREAVTPESVEWGYVIGSVYIRKVHFRDEDMNRQIEEKVVNRLRQVTSAIKQDGTNQVNIIASRAEKEASVEFAKASAARPQIVGATIQKISQDPEVLASLFDILECNKIAEGSNELVLLPADSQNNLLSQLLAAEHHPESKK